MGKTVARFPQTELTLSALPKGEKKRILKQDELDKAGGITKVFVNKLKKCSSLCNIPNLLRYLVP